MKSRLALVLFVSSFHHGWAETIDSAWTWGYFFAADKEGVNGIFPEKGTTRTLYRVDKVVAVRGEPGVTIEPGSPLVRVETAARLLAPQGAQPRLLFHGLPQHLEYTSAKQRADLIKSSRPEIPPGKDTVAVIIPIHKSSEWWALPHDERMSHFQPGGDTIGHTAIGAGYTPQIYRKLYHTRYVVESTGHDFITYFEFDRAHSEAFKSLLEQLRDQKQNPEWKYVDREYEIWLTKLE